MKYGQAIKAAKARTGTSYICARRGYYVTDNPKSPPIAVVTVADGEIRIEGGADTPPRPDSRLRQALREVWSQEATQS